MRQHFRLAPVFSVFVIPAVLSFFIVSSRIVFADEKADGAKNNPSTVKSDSVVKSDNVAKSGSVVKSAPASSRIKPNFEANNPNFYQGTDSERMERALENASSFGGIVRITRRIPDQSAQRDFWLIDRAILLPANTTLIIENCVIKLSDQARDNFIRSANCGTGIAKPKEFENIHIMGIGQAELVGADHPRATGDGAKKLGERTYGTDAGKPNESPTGDWRNIGVLFAWVKNFSIRGITIREAHCWSMSMERCSHGLIRDISFYSSEKRVIDGKPVKTLNQDGLDLRKGCHDIIIDSIKGQTGDDLVALTAIRSTIHPGGLLGMTEVSEMESLGPHNDIWNVTIRNVSGFANGGHQIVRLLNASGIRIHHVIIDGVLDATPEDLTDRATVKIGDVVPAWGGATPLGDTYAIIVNNVITKSKYGVVVLGSLCDSVISNVVNLNPETTGVSFVVNNKEFADPQKASNVRNVRVLGVVDPQKK